MDLATFGAILRFAMELEGKAEAFYREAGFAEATAAAAKRLRLLEQARREGVAEMILEPITGLDTAAYAAHLEKAADVSRFEGACARFYKDAAAKLPIREVVRLFQRLALEHEATGAQAQESQGASRRTEGG
jgi:rubrerythrin